MKVHIETITPERATELLGHNTANRPANQRHVEMLAKEMQEGRFVATGQTIQVADTSRLLDGQHRLLALIKANFTCTFVMVSDLPESIFPAIDRGRRRTPGDVLGIVGYSNARARAALIASLMNHENKRHGVAIAQGGGEVSWPPELIIQYAATHDLERALSDSNRYSAAGPFLSRNSWGFLSEVLHRIDADAAPDFLQELATGAGLQEGDVVLFVRTRIINAALHASQSMSMSVRIQYIYKAWNRVRDGQRTSVRGVGKGIIKITNNELELPR